MADFDRNSALISGVVSFFQIHVEQAEDEEDDRLYRFALETQSKLRHDVEELIRETLGPEFQIQSLNLRRGSVTILIAISAAYAFYMSFSRYESFIKSSNLLASQIKSVVKRIFGQASSEDELEVSATWNPMSPITEAHNVFRRHGGFDSNLLLLAYILVSHAALLGVFIWLLIHHLK